MITVTIPGSIRSKKNSRQPLAIPSPGKSTLYKLYPKAGFKPVRVINVPSAAYRKWEYAARTNAAKQYLGPPMDGEVHVCAMIYYKGQQPDLSGCLESIGDAMEGILWADDKQIVSWDGSRRQKDNANPRTEVVVCEVGG